MAIEYVRIHNAAFELYVAAFNVFGEDPLSDDACRPIKHYFLIQKLEESMQRMRTVAAAKSRFSHFVRPITKMKTLGGVLPDVEHQWRVRELDSEVDSIHRRSNAALLQAWKQLAESGL